MKKSSKRLFPKLIYMLELLSLQERDRFLLFLKSPYFNDNQPTTLLGEILIHALHKNRLEKVTRPYLLSRIYPDKNVNHQQVNKLANRLLKLLLKFMQQEVYEDKKGVQMQFLLQAFNQYKADKYFDYYYERIIKSMDKGKEKGYEHYQQMESIEGSKTIYNFRQQGRKAKLNLAAANHALDNYFISQKLRYAYLNLTKAKVLGSPLELHLLEDILRHVQNTLENQPLPVQMHYHLYMSELFPEEEKYFYVLKTFINEHKELLSKTQLQELYGGILNYCTRKINSGREFFLTEAFELYQLLIESEWLMVDEMFSHLHFKNIISLACKLKKFDWANNFIKTFSPLLDADMQEVVVLYNEAIIDHYKGKLDIAANKLNRVIHEFEDMFYHLHARTILLQIYYERKDSISAESQKESFRMYLKRRVPLTRQRKARYNAFINAYSVLLRIFIYSQKPETDLQKVINRAKKLQDKIKDSTQIVAKKWLLQQVEEWL